MSYLAGSSNETSQDGTIIFNRKKVFFHTIFFVLGISFAFFILGMTFTALGSFFKSNRLLLTRIAGIIVIIFGLFQLGLFDLKFLNQQRRIQLNLNKRKVNPLVAFILGFTFSFAWTPCVGPALSSVLILASSANNYLIGNLLVLLYTVGFIIPFLLLGLFTTRVLNFLDKHKKAVKYTVKIGGIILILIGIMIFTGWMNNISSYLNSIPNRQEELDDSSADEDQISEEDSTAENEFPADDFTLIDQYGNEHTLSEYKDKVVFINFWATWCPPCRAEMPDIEALYYEYGQNEEDVIIIGIASPKSDKNLYTKEVDKEGVIQFLEENDITFPILFDETGSVFNQYGISSLPTSYFIDKDGNIYGFAPGMISKDVMKNTIETLRNPTE
jgi:cytochrome c-type biogenesis protein